MARFTLASAPGLDAAGVALLNERFDQAARGAPPGVATEAWLSKLAQTLLDDAVTQRKVSEAFTSYLARGNREDLA